MILCPRCGEGLDDKHRDECEKRKHTRRFFFGLLGGMTATSGLLPLMAKEDVFDDPMVLRRGDKFWAEKGFSPLIRTMAIIETEKPVGELLPELRRCNLSVPDARWKDNKKTFGLRIGPGAGALHGDTKSSVYVAPFNCRIDTLLGCRKLVIERKGRWS